MALITLTNDFHNSSVTIRCEVLSDLPSGAAFATAYPSASQIKRAKKALCGVAGCCCSNAAGIRGQQKTSWGKRLEVDLTADEAKKAGYNSKGTR
jgi:hypothetical protein